MIRQYYWYLLMLLVLFLYTACSKATRAIAPTDNNPPDIRNKVSEEYKGYRLAFVNLESTDKKVIRGTLINTGKYKVILPLKNNTAIVINFDHTLEGQDLLSFSNPIKQEILQQSFILEPGQIVSNFSIPIGAKKGTNATSSEEVLASKVEDFKDHCPDLQIDTFYVSKRTKKYAEITFKIVNVGKGPAPLFGDTKDLEDNVAIRAYASGTQNLSRGDLIMGGSFIKSGLKDKKGILQPSESFAGAFRVDIRKKTRHMPYIIISIDDYQQLWECDEGNNVKEMVYR